MAKALVIYGSTTGNTETTAQLIASTIADNEVETILKDVAAAEAGDLSEPYDVYLLGCSTWGDDEIELQEDFEPFYENMGGLDLSGKKIAVFGCGDSTYTHFCGAVDAVEQRAESQGAELVVSGLRIDGDPDDAEEDIVAWAHSVASEI